MEIRKAQPEPITMDNCERLTSFSPSRLAQLTGIEGGYSAEEYSFEISGYSNYPRITVKSNDGNVELHRSFDFESKIIGNDSIKIKNSNEGLAYTIFKKQVEEAVASGFERIECIAGSDSTMNGAYVWARFGYIIDGYAKTSVQTHLKEKGYEGDQVDPHLIVQSKEGRNWWKQNCTSWSGTFDLYDGSESRKILDNYKRSDEEDEYYED
jgi:hypothetical protein